MIMKVAKSFLSASALTLIMSIPTFSIYSLLIMMVMLFVYEKIKVDKCMFIKLGSFSFGVIAVMLKRTNI